MPIEYAVPPPKEAPYPFCEACLDEYQAFKRLEDGHAPEAFWHTEEWAEAWRSWLKYMRAKDQFRQSPVFLRLIEEYGE